VSLEAGLAGGHGLGRGLLGMERGDGTLPGPTTQPIYGFIVLNKNSSLSSLLNISGFTILNKNNNL
jgi:hypothetical protein